MNATEIIQLMGVLYFVFGLAFLFNKKHYLNLFKEIFKSKIFMFMGGYIAFVLGFIIVLYFNSFTLTKEGLVAVLGYMALIKGIILLLFPKFMTKITKIFINKKYFDLVGFSVTTLGLILIYLGFLA